MIIEIRDLPNGVKLKSINIDFDNEIDDGIRIQTSPTNVSAFEAPISNYSSISNETKLKSQSTQTVQHENHELDIPVRPNLDIQEREKIEVPPEMFGNEF